MPQGNNVIELVINNKPIAFVPNTLKFKTGQGEQVVRTQASGSNIEIVTYDNLETNKSMVMFDVFNTNENIQNAIEWKSLAGLIAVTLSGPNLTTGFTFQQMTFINDFEIELISEGVISVELEGLPVV